MIDLAAALGAPVSAAPPSPNGTGAAATDFASILAAVGLGHLAAGAAETAEAVTTEEPEADLADLLEGEAEAPAGESGDDLTAGGGPLGEFVSPAAPQSAKPVVEPPGHIAGPEGPPHGAPAAERATAATIGAAPHVSGLPAQPAPLSGSGPVTAAAPAMEHAAPAAPGPIATPAPHTPEAAAIASLAALPTSDQLAATEAPPSVGTSTPVPATATAASPAPEAAIATSAAPIPVAGTPAPVAAPATGAGESEPAPAFATQIQAPPMPEVGPAPETATMPDPGDGAAPVVAELADIATPTPEVTPAPPGQPVIPEANNPTGLVVAPAKESAPAVEATAAAAETLATPDAEPTPPPAQQIAAALREVRRLADGTHRLSLQLRPAELGSVQLEIALRDGRLHLQAVAETQGTARAIESALPELRSELHEAGVDTGSLEVRDHRPDPNTDRRRSTSRSASSSPGSRPEATPNEPTIDPIRRSTSSIVDVRI